MASSKREVIKAKDFRDLSSTSEESENMLDTSHFLQKAQNTMKVSVSDLPLEFQKASYLNRNQLFRRLEWSWQEEDIPRLQSHTEETKT